MTGAEKRWVLSRLDADSHQATADAVARCGGRVVDHALDRALLVEASDAAIDRLRRQMPGLAITPERLL